jgi:hypothetical protein
MSHAQQKDFCEQEFYRPYRDRGTPNRQIAQRCRGNRVRKITSLPEH